MKASFDDIRVHYILRKGETQYGTCPIYGAMNALTIRMVMINTVEVIDAA